MFKLIVAFIFSSLAFTAMASEPRQITIADFGETTHLPYHWFNYCTNEMEGSNVQLVKWIFKELDIQVNFTKSNSNTRDSALNSGELDALFFTSSRSTANVIKVKTPIIETGLSIFYPTHLGTLENTTKLRPLQGAFLPIVKSRGTSKVVKQWAEAKQLNVIIASDENEYLKIIQSTKDHFILLYKYNDKIDRKPYNILENQVATGNYYFALANRSPWKEILPLVDEKFSFAKTSGLMALLKETSFKRWLKEKDTIQACKQALEVK